MKKIFTLITALFACAVINAQTEIPLELTEGHTLLMETIENAGSTSDDDIVRFYINNNSGASRDGWGIGGFAESDNWGPVVSWTGKAGDSFEIEHTVGEIKAVAAAGQYHGVGITINIYNDCKVDHVTLVLAGELPTWEETGKEITLDGTLIPASEFEGYTLGAKVLIDFTVEGPIADDEVAGWGIGRYGSADMVVEWDSAEGKDVVKSGIHLGNLTIPQEEGVNTIETTLAKLKDALSSAPDAQGRYGLKIETYTQKNCKVTSVVVTIKELNNSTEETFVAPEDVTPGGGDDDGDDMEGYEDPVDITSAMDEWGNIESKTFNGFSDDAIVVFTWNSAGPDVKIGWGAGSLGSILMTDEEQPKPVVDLGENFAIQQEGENKVQKTIAELKEALNAGPDQYGRYGLYWNMWSFDGCSNERVSVKVYEVEGFEGEGYMDPVTSAIKTVSTVNVKVAKVLKNGQIIISNNGNEFNVAGQLVK